MDTRKLQYRPDIDGLRAIAVAMVVAFHAGVPGIGGGYIGVDVFFVISGYLITLQLLQTDFSGLLIFYQRRAARILPAISTVLLFVAVAGWLLMPPYLLKLTGGDIGWTSLFGMNMRGWRTVGYFNSNGELRPLLHAWSLGVEEQFYFIFPAILLLTRKSVTRTTLLALAIAACVASLALQIWLMQGSDDAGFYLLPARAWELGVGAILAIWGGYARGAIAANSALVAGLAAIGWAGITYVPGTEFPGVAALPPVLGTAAVIWASAGKMAGAARLLTLRPLVGLGLISYGFYLWHWPLLVYVKFVLGRQPDAGETWLLILAALALAYASWRLIEEPIRKKARQPIGLSRLATFVAVAVAVPALLGFWFNLSGGVPSRLPVDIRDLEQLAAPARLLLPDCQTTAEDCSYRAASPDKGTIGIWGDSHTGHFSPSVAAEAGPRGYTVRRLMVAACLPVLDPVMATRHEGSARERCSKGNAAAQQILLYDLELKLVIIAARWASSAGSDPVDVERAVEEAIVPFLARDVPVLLVEQTPQFSLQPMVCLTSHAMLRDRHLDCRAPDDTKPGHRLAVHAAFTRIAARHAKVDLFTPATLMCDNTFCDPLLGGKLLMEDKHHLSVDGAKFMQRPLWAAVQSAIDGEAKISNARSTR